MKTFNRRKFSGLYRGVFYYTEMSFHGLYESLLINRRSLLNLISKRILDLTVWTLSTFCISLRKSFAFKFQSE